jgi:hypothetical protein
MDEIAKFYQRETEPDIVQIYMYMKRKALIFIRHRSTWIQFTTVDVPEE